MYENDDIRGFIKHTLAVSFMVNTTYLQGDYDEVWLTYNPFNLKGRHLIHLFYLLETEYGITFTESDIIDYSFLTIENIHKCIENHICARPDV